MDKEILRHREFMQTKLERLASERRGKQQSEQLWLLWRYHHYQVQNFQHERQIHLLVTITFGLIMLGGWAGLLGWLVVTGGSFDTVTWLIIALVTILTILEGAYLGYYYRLENRVQLLYQLDDQIYRALL